MVWAAFCYERKSLTCYITTNMNAPMYLELLDSELIEFARQLYEDNWILQQDNASIHNATFTKKEWPEKGPDLHPIDELWGILSD